MVGNSGNNVLSGGAGNDTYVVDNTGDQVNENANEGTDTVNASVSFTLGADVENLLLTGTAAINGTGNSLANIINGNSAANTLNGGSGDDTLDGGAGADSMIGGAGNDAYYLDNGNDVVTENANEGVDVVYASTHYALTANVENLTLLGSADLQGYGNGLANALIGNTGSNILNGNAGADTMVGGTGNDSYFVDDVGDVVIEYAGEGLDSVYASINYTLGANLENLHLTDTGNINGTGNALANVLVGNSGNNTLNGGTGNDALHGGGGYDTYVFAPGGGQDIIVNGVSTNGGPSGELDFSSGINVNQLWFKQSGNNLTIQVMGGQDQVTVSNWFSSNTGQLQEIKAGGLEIDSGVAQLVQAMATYSANNSGFDPTSATQAPNDSTLQSAIAAAWHS
jgi:Ca2+-binding RTX toxin-like protein